MIEQDTKHQPLRALVVDDGSRSPTAEGRATRAFVHGAAKSHRRGRRGEFRRGWHVRFRVGLRDPRRAGRLVAGRRAGVTKRSRSRSGSRARAQRQNSDLPDGRARKAPRSRLKSWNRSTSSSGPSKTCRHSSAARAAAIRRYSAAILPPLAKAMRKFTREYEYSWHTPGHQGGTAFLKSPVERVSSIISARTRCVPTSRSASGASAPCSITTGPIGEHEKYAARVFGAHRT